MLSPTPTSNAFSIARWLMDASDPIECDKQDPSPPPPLLLSYGTPPSSRYTFASHCKSQRRKRRKLGSMSENSLLSNSTDLVSMDSETASVASRDSARTRKTTSSATSFQKNRPILSPTAPSTRQRSPSPTRKILSQLKLATPSLRVCQPDVRLPQPHAVQELRVKLMRELSSGVFPRSFETRLRLLDPDQFEVSTTLYQQESVEQASDLDALWKITDRIYNDARRCHDNHLDESAWMKVVNSVLESADLGQESSMLRVHSIQTQSIDPAFLPRHTSQSFAKKADLALAFNSDHPTVATAIEPIQKANPDLALSHMTDAYTSTVPLVCCLEVKERGGDYNEAIIQLAIWCAAGLEQLKEIRNASRNHVGPEELPPFIGWTVIGHDWKFHITWKDVDGNVIVLGPWRLLNAGTGSHLEILILLALIRRVKKWLEEEYWVWLCDNLLDNLT